MCSLLSFVLVSKLFSLTNSDFFHFRMIEILQILANLIIAGIVVYFVSDRLNDNVKRKDRLVKYLSDLEGLIESIYKNGNEFFRSKKKDQELITLISNELQCASIKISFLIKLNEKSRLPIRKKVFNEIEPMFIRFKKSLTGENFPEKDKLDEKEFQNSYEELIDNLEECCLELFN